MEQSTFKKIFVGFLSLLMASAVLLCIFTEIAPPSHEMNGMASNPGALANHLSHAQELSWAKITETSLVLAILFAIGQLALFVLTRKITIAPQRLLQNHFRKRYRDISHIAQLSVHRWLSLFEQSPNFASSA